MILLVAKIIIILFGLFLIAIGFLMLFTPEKARATLRKAGSTNFINYAEITIRMIPAAAMVVFEHFTGQPLIFKLLGWFMIATSLILYFIPRKWHHNYSLKAAEILKPKWVRLISPLSFLFGLAVIYAVR